MVVSLGVVYVLANLGQVIWAAHQEQVRRVQAIVVLGAAQYNGVPSPDLVARLSHALTLWRDGYAPILVVTGGKQPADEFTEADTGASWLAERGVPQADILREVHGRDTWESLSSVSQFLQMRGIRRVLLVSDPFHDDRVLMMSTELGMVPFVSPTHTSPVRGLGVVPYFAKETLEVSIGRIIGFRRLHEVDLWAQDTLGLGWLS